MCDLGVMRICFDFVMDMVCFEIKSDVWVLWFYVNYYS